VSDPKVIKTSSYVNGFGRPDFRLCWSGAPTLPALASQRSWLTALVPGWPLYLCWGNLFGTKTRSLNLGRIHSPMYYLHSKIYFFRHNVRTFLLFKNYENIIYSIIRYTLNILICFYIFKKNKNKNTYILGWME
jgi:hypothetical protein